MKTIEDLRAFVVAQTEDSTVAERVSSWADRHNGKPLTVRNCPEGLRVVKQYGMTSLESPRTTDGNYLSFLIAHETVNVMIPTVAVLREKNPAYYKGREERNHKRMELSNNGHELKRLFNVFADLQRAAEIYRETAKRFDVVCDYPDGVPDYYELRKLAGWIDERR